MPIHGFHQGDNAASALAAAEAFFGVALAPDVVAEAFANVEMPGRMEIVGRSPLVLLDGAHNAAGMAVLARSLEEEFDAPGSQVAVVGMLEGRDPTAMLEALLSTRVETVVACAARSARAMSPETVCSAAKSVGLTGLLADSTEDALVMAKDRVGNDGLVVVAGSLYVVAEAREALVETR